MPSLVVFGMGSGAIIPTWGFGSNVDRGMVQGLDARTVEVIFKDEPPNYLVPDRELALLTTNYSIAPALTIHRVIYVTDFHYQLITDRQEIGETYILTITGF